MEDLALQNVQVCSLVLIFEWSQYLLILLLIVGEDQDGVGISVLHVAAVDSRPQGIPPGARYIHSLAPSLPSVDHVRIE